MATAAIPGIAPGNLSKICFGKLLDEGLPYTVIGHTRWVTGKDLIEHLQGNAERKTS